MYMLLTVQQEASTQPLENQTRVNSEHVLLYHPLKELKSRLKL